MRSAIVRATHRPRRVAGALLLAGLVVLVAVLLASDPAVLFEKMQIEQSSIITTVIVVNRDATFTVCTDCDKPGKGYTYKWDGDLKDVAGGKLTGKTVMATKKFPKESNHKEDHEAIFILYKDGVEQWRHPMKFTVGSVTFNVTEVRPGVSVAGKPSRAVAVEANVKPNDIKAYFRSNHTRATVAPISGQGKVKLKVDGVQLSAADQDTNLEARFNSPDGADSLLANQIPITVVEPDDYVEPGTMTDYPPPKLVAGHQLKAIRWENPVPVGILDQFGKLLRSNWDGLIVQEKIGTHDWGGFDSDHPDTPAILTGGYIIDHDRYTVTFQTSGEAEKFIKNKSTIVLSSFDNKVVQLIRVRLDDGTFKQFSAVNTRHQIFDAPQKTYTTTNSH